MKTKKEVVSRLSAVRKIENSKPKKRKEGEELTPAEKKRLLPTYAEKYEELLLKQLFEEELRKKEKESEAEESEYYEDFASYHKKNRNGYWDVPSDQEIKYFDPDLSYEITGYRPITMEQGLDFDPEPFCEAARTYESSGSYTTFPKGCKPYIDYWKEQKRRCVEGYTVGKYRITGDHYFFLNFYRMQTVNKGDAKQVTGRNESFPSFLSKQYEFFHYIEMCEHIGKDCAMLKSRGLEYWTL